MYDVRLYFDFLSPYVFLALQELERFEEEHEVTFDLRPVVYGAILDATGLVGPAEVSAKRRYTWVDVWRSAAERGLTLKGPPSHPFRSLESLRAFCLFRTDPRAPRLAAAMSAACWVEGSDLTDFSVLADVIASVGLDADDLAARASDPAIKAELRAFTEEALGAGVFGVPTFAVGNELFWGHDRMPTLAARLDGSLPPLGEGIERMLARPRGADRRGSPARGEGSAGGGGA